MLHNSREIHICRDQNPEVVWCLDQKTSKSPQVFAWDVYSFLFVFFRFFDPETSGKKKGFQEIWWGVQQCRHLGLTWCQLQISLFSFGLECYVHRIHVYGIFDLHLVDFIWWYISTHRIHGTGIFTYMNGWFLCFFPCRQIYQSHGSYGVGNQMAYLLKFDEWNLNEPGDFQDQSPDAEVNMFKWTMSIFRSASIISLVFLSCIRSVSKWWGF